MEFLAQFVSKVCAHELNLYKYILGIFFSVKLNDYLLAEIIVDAFHLAVSTASAIRAWYTQKYVARQPVTFCF